MIKALDLFNLTVTMGLTCYGLYKNSILIIASAISYIVTIIYLYMPKE